MKLFTKTLIFFSLASLSLEVEAKQIEILFDHSSQEEFFLDSPIDDKGLEIPFNEGLHPTYCRKVTLENKGSEIVKDLLPYNHEQPLFTLQTLSEKLFLADQPVQTLYSIWTHRVIIVEQADIPDFDPLFVLNFKGNCNQGQYLTGFLTLCRQLGFDIRAVNISGKDCYDICYQGKWEFFDPITKQIYFGWDNQTLVSSEEVMDDPLLALRTQTQRRIGSHDIVHAWQEVARFEIAHPNLTQELVSEAVQNHATLSGFDFYPGDKINYWPNSLIGYPYGAEHVLNLAVRDSNFTYHSPFPITGIRNSTDSPLTILGQVIEPGQFIVLTSPLFSFDVNAFQVGTIDVFSDSSEHTFLNLNKGKNSLHLGTNNEFGKVQVTFELDDQLENDLKPSVNVVNDNRTFDYCIPSFQLESTANVDKIWWQISKEKDFAIIPSNFDQVQVYSSIVTLPALSDTFFNADDKYFFRVKGCVNGAWTEWSSTYEFIIKKPDALTSYKFEKIGDKQYEINWETDENSHVEYYVFGSNSLDFVPSIYTPAQIDAMMDGEVIQEKSIDNLQTITQEQKIIVDGSWAYYRILAKKNGQFSVPSPLIHVYDSDMVQNRDVLQIVDDQDGHVVLKRMDIPHSYSWMDAYLPRTQLKAWQDPIDKINGVVFRQLEADVSHPYERSPHVTPEIWETVKPYLFPENHPMKPKLDRLFSSTRVTMTNETFKKAGFKRNRIGRFSRIMASSNPKLEGLFIKAFADTELLIPADWKKLLHRIEGARSIQACILRHGYQDTFKVPNKWLYPLPADPSPPNNPKRYLRKNFILVAEDMRIYEHDKNEKYYKKKMDRNKLNMLFTIFEEEGLFDSVYAFNVPFCKDGKLAFIDTEHHHRWPVPYHKLDKYFSKDMRQYWNRLVKAGGPDHLKKK